ncbi:MAG TPA: UDP-N-acetylmuramate dehydrogenase [Caldisericia bacterium]|jgi:UDP-N-acetylmuramate dehydrogenase|nr:MAG: UDP-N-acetylenolpyruvoylglucosamine reductase [bacterium ADurb.Bin132]HNY61786.1 UDP-N-acetylmuramate dehydrogenase [Caldisericia bacterium]HOC79386.1 UDP-N-acetylmuramate dehydrogenase [Caldisericia bacterium]HOG70805.1 UDP-N-acetylmuramate dehydrogenase [Caldisericia bacterium]HPA66027.1 UDP-N-acetylmuramate dehydrogenase [Caldisericia bacterium]
MIPTPLTGLKSAIRGEVLFGEPMTHHTSFAVGGPADAFVVPYDADDVLNIYDYSCKMHVPVLVIGGGTNLLVGDLGIRGIVMKVGKGLDEILWEGDSVIVGGGVALSKFVSESVERNLAGLQYCYGIPGTVGGAVAMNAGTSAMYISRCVVEVGYILPSGEKMTLTHEKMGFDYRSSVVLRSGGLIEWVRFQLKPADPEALKANIEKIRDYRQRTQPWGYPNAGCVFRNPPAAFAGQLIDQAGLKGQRLGGVAVSDIHANFLVNMGGATSLDVIQMMMKVVGTIYNLYNIRLLPEVRILGEWSVPLPSWA